MGNAIFQRGNVMQDDGYLDLGSHDSFADGVPHKTFERLRRDDPLSAHGGQITTTSQCIT